MAEAALDLFRDAWADEIAARAAASAADSLSSFCALMLPGYQRPSHVSLLIDRLEAVERGEIRRLAVFMPPRHGKSMTTSEAFPAWFLGRRPRSSVIAASHTQELADDFGRKVRNIMRDEIYSSVFPDSRLRADSTSVRRFHTASGGAYFAAGVCGAITGRGADLLLIDDPIKNRSDAESPQRRHQTWEWYTSTAYTRLAPESAVVLIQTRWHPDDLAGRVLKYHAGEGWVVLDMPAVSSDGAALWPERFGLSRLDAIRSAIGQREWDALYQQRPTSFEGGVFRASAIDRWIGTVPWVSQIDATDSSYRRTKIVTGVDLATRRGEGHDLTVLATIAQDGHRWRLLHMTSARLEATEILRAILDVHRRFHARAGSARFVVEDNAAQAYIVQMCKDARVLGALGATTSELQRINVHGATTTSTKRSAELGIPSIASDIEMGRWDFPDHPEVRALRDEMLGWSPDSHTGDRLMALWIARGCLRAAMPGVRAL